MRALRVGARLGSVGNSDAPQATGGGSTGYNEMLRNY